MRGINSSIIASLREAGSDHVVTDVKGHFLLGQEKFHDRNSSCISSVSAAWTSHKYCRPHHISLHHSALKLMDQITIFYPG